MITESLRGRSEPVRAQPEDRQRGRRGDLGIERGRQQIAHGEERERDEVPHFAPEPDASVVNVLMQIARSTTSDRCRRYQRSYESFFDTPSKSEPV